MQAWVDICQALELGKSARLNCECGPGKTAHISNNPSYYRYYCYRCSKEETIQKENRKITDLKIKGNEICQIDQTLPEDYVMDLPDPAIVWLWNRGIGTYLQQQYKLGWSEELNRLIVPYYKKNELIAILARDITGKMERKALNSENRKDSWFYSIKAESKGKTLVLVEDCFSAMKVGEIEACVALNGTSLDNSGLKKCLVWKKIIIMLDPDKAGKNASIKIKHKLQSLVETKIVCPPRDPKYLSIQELKELL